MSLEKVLAEMMHETGARICISQNMWELFGYELAKMNPNTLICLHDAAKPENRKLELLSHIVVHHPDIAGKAPEEIVAYFEAFELRTGVSIIDRVK